MRRWTGPILMCIFATFSWVTMATPVDQNDERWHDLGNTSLYPLTASLSYEWFYFDVQHKGGAQLALAFLGPNPFDITLADITSGNMTLGHVGVVAQGYIPGVGSVQCFDSLEDASKLSYSESSNGRRWKLQIDGSEVRMHERGNGLRDYDIQLNVTCRYQGQVVGTVTGALQYKGQIPGWKHKNGNLTELGGLYNSWVVTSPMAIVTGQYTFNLLDETGAQNSVSVTVDHDFGYHDHNRGNMPITATNEGWFWGRATTDSGKVVVYAYMTGKDKPDFPGDLFVPTPASAILYMNDGNRTLIDTENVNFAIVGNEVEYKDPSVGIDVMMPLQYNLTHSRYKFAVTLPQAVTAAVPYYFRQASEMEITFPNGSKESAQVVNEQMEFKPFFQYIGLPVYP